VTSVSQVGTDRIVDIAFSDGHYRLFLEFYAGGNVVLTDRELNVIALLRTVAKGEGLGQEELRVGIRYAIEERQNYGGVPELTKERVKERFKSFVQRDRQGAVGGKRKRKKADALRRALSDGFPKYPPILLDHAFRVLNFDTTTPLEKILEDEGLLESVLLVLQEAEKVTTVVTSNDRPRGYIIAKSIQKSSAAPSSTPDPPTEERGDHAGLLYDDFHPFKPQQFEDNPDLTVVEHDGFNKTVDEFFSSLESQKLESRLNEREANAQRKLDVAKQDQKKRLGALQEVQELHIRKAEAIEANIERVEEAIGAVNGLIGQGMDWVEIARLIEMEQGKQNPVAQIIKLPLKLYENTVTLLLGEASVEPEEDDEGYETESDIDSDEEVKQEASKKGPVTDQRLAIDIDLALSPWSNAREYYDQRRSAAVKEQKTLQSSSKALQSTERKINADLKRELKQEKQVLRPARKQFWFEKFIFFISSDGYLVIGYVSKAVHSILDYG
jgi:predicted ribosome quality control (RQC) complex YloA/Tae2 family protein